MTVGPHHGLHGVAPDTHGSLEKEGERRGWVGWEEEEKEDEKEDGYMECEHKQEENDVESKNKKIKK